ncbi:MAG: phosphate signaling complex protein PhoU, partial [Dehalococcoidales bacterium]|nr:phosphate signaling complex protein PhoU [Dehalococcoidales bacterium]
MEIRTAFHKKLKEIQDEILAMGSMVSKAMLHSIDALKNRDVELARQIIADDQKINHKRFEIEEKCIELIATQQPMASDLRTIVTVLNIISEVERIGDYAEGIAKITIMIGDEPPLKPLIDIPRMAEQTVNMLRRSLDAFITHDSETARKIIAEDD